MSKISKKVNIMLFALMALFVWSGSALAGYSITDLGMLAGTTSSKGVSINDLGQVAGTSSTRGFIYSNGTMTDLGAPPVAFITSGMNTSGQIAGYAYVDNVLTSFLYNGGTLTTLGFVGQVNAINDKGQMTGQDKSNQNAMIYSNGVMTYLGTLGGASSLGYAINNSGQVAGYSLTSSGQAQAFLYSNGAMTGIGTLGGTNSYAYAINESGQVTGTAGINGDIAHAFIYSNGKMTDLGLGCGYGINNAGQVVGMSANHATLYSNDTMIDLNTLLPANSGWTLNYAKDINNLGQITGYGKINGQTHAYIMTPTPIPPAFYMFGSGLLGLVGIRRKIKSSV